MEIGDLDEIEELTVDLPVKKQKKVTNQIAFNADFGIKQRIYVNKQNN